MTMEIHITCRRCKKEIVEEFKTSGDGISFLEDLQYDRDEYACKDCWTAYNKLKDELKTKSIKAKEEFWKCNL